MLVFFFLLKQLHDGHVQLEIQFLEKICFLIDYVIYGLTVPTERAVTAQAEHLTALQCSTYSVWMAEALRAAAGLWASHRQAG